jgi:hypothetical protein
VEVNLKPTDYWEYCHVLRARVDRIWHMRLMWPDNTFMPVSSNIFSSDCNKNVYYAFSVYTEITFFLVVMLK